jgi:hypothetical protein
MFCQYCNRLAKSQRSNQQHEIRCKENPSGVRVKPSYGMLGKKGANQYTYGATCSDDTRKKLSESTSELNKKRWSDPANRIKQSGAMKRAVENNPESYTSANRGRTKQIIVDGIKFQGQWEVDFYLWAKEAGLNPIRATKGFKYHWNGERTYFPDFYIESKDLYVEVKGYETERDRSKWSQFPEKLCIIKEKEIKQIREGCFVGL